jgi:preprotein translocase subunit SecA
MAGRRWSDGLHQAVEAKEGLQIRAENQTLATITYQNFFRLYKKLSGMTGTALTEAAEFVKIYNLDVVTIPTNRRLRRPTTDDLIYRTEPEKWKAVVAEIEKVHKEGRPILVGTTSVAKSEKLAAFLSEKGLSYDLLNAKQHEREANIIAKAGEKGALTIATNMAGRGTDIILGPGVAELGGLHVVGTERHEARRIDNQLRGRAGRQGDPGSSQFFLSLEDDLMRIFAKDWVGNMLKSLGMQEDEAIQSTTVSRMIERVQKKMEAHNFDIRKNLLEYDYVNNEQRKEIYGWRQSILEGADQGERVLWFADETCKRLAQNHLVPNEAGDPVDVEAMRRAFHQRFNGEAPEASAFAEASAEAGAQLLGDRAKEIYRARREQIGPERMQSLERYLLLQTIDDKWKDHLHALDYLRTGVGMRGYGQEDPKIVYRRQAAEYFGQMLSAIQEQVVDLAFHVEPPSAPREHEDGEVAPPPGASAAPAGFDDDDWGPDDDDTDWDAVARQAAAPPAPTQPTAAMEAELETSTATATMGPPPAALADPAAETSSAPAPAYREQQKRLAERRDAGRPAGDPLFAKKDIDPNALCPCGSGKKYKKCHAG